MNTYKRYSDLTIHERINFRSAWDIAVACESGSYNRLRSCVGEYIPIACCQQVYDIDRFYRSARTCR